MSKKIKLNLSKSEKLEICQKAYDRIFNYEGNGKINFICVAIELYLPYNDNKPIKAHEAIPELLKYKPENREPNNHWFSTDSDGMNKRRQVLLSLINDLRED